jgi:hypothetical protein
MYHKYQLGDTTFPIEQYSISLIWLLVVKNNYRNIVLAWLQKDSCKIHQKLSKGTNAEPQ